MRNFVLYADDDFDDQAWVSEAYEAVRPPFTISFVQNGRELFNYLQPLSADNLPALIVLDLNMPELDGRETLQRLKNNLFYQHIPVAIVTTSSNKIDREICERLGASLFLEKPVLQYEWKSIIHQLGSVASF